MRNRRENMSVNVIALITTPSDRISMWDECETFSCSNPDEDTVEFQTRFDVNISVTNDDFERELYLDEDELRLAVREYVDNIDRCADFEIMNWTY